MNTCCNPENNENVCTVFSSQLSPGIQRTSHWIQWPQYGSVWLVLTREISAPIQDPFECLPALPERENDVTSQRISFHHDCKVLCIIPTTVAPCHSIGRPDGPATGTSISISTLPSSEVSCFSTNDISSSSCALTSK